MARKHKGALSGATQKDTGTIPTPKAVQPVLRSFEECQRVLDSGGLLSAAEVAALVASKRANELEQARGETYQAFLKNCREHLNTGESIGCEGTRPVGRGWRVFPETGEYERAYLGDGTD